MKSSIPIDRYSPLQQPSILSSPYPNSPLTSPIQHSPFILSTLCTLLASTHTNNSSREMATISTAALSATALSGSSLSSCMRRKPGVVYIEGLNSFGGLKAHNSIASLGMPKCSEQSFAMVVNSLKGKRESSRGGALSSTCNAAAEIFKIASIMNGLVLVGVAVGFVLLRIEATLEEAE